MTLEKHDLIHELPEYRDQIREMKMNNAHFSKLFEAYHEVDHEIHRIETGVETPTDEYLEGRKINRLKLKDEMFQMLKNAEATA